MHASTPTLPHSGGPGSRPGPVTDLGRILLGLTVVTLGVLFLLDAAGALDAGDAIDNWWPLLLVAGGLLTLAERPPGVLRGVVLMVAGGVGLLLTNDLLDERAWAYVWPALVIAAGVVVLIRRGVPIAATPQEDVVRSTAVFGGPKVASTSRAFRGAWLTAFFGGITLDLRGAELAPEGATINATVAFGGIDILVPRGWRISVRSTPIFGGLDDKTDSAQDLPEDAPVLHVDAVAIFGGVDITHEKDSG